MARNYHVLSLLYRWKSQILTITRIMWIIYEFHTLRSSCFPCQTLFSDSGYFFWITQASYQSLWLDSRYSPSPLVVSLYYTNLLTVVVFFENCFPDFICWIQGKYWHLLVFSILLLRWRAEYFSVLSSSILQLFHYI